MLLSFDAPLIDIILEHFLARMAERVEPETPIYNIKAAFPMQFNAAAAVDVGS